MSHKNVRPFIVKVSVLGYFPLYLLFLLDIIIYTYLYHDYFRGSVIGEGVGIRYMYPITDPLFILVNIIISKI